MNKINHELKFFWVVALRFDVRRHGLGRGENPRAVHSHDVWNTVVVLWCGRSESASQKNIDASRGQCGWLGRCFWNALVCDASSSLGYRKVAEHARPDCHCLDVIFVPGICGCVGALVFANAT